MPQYDIWTEFWYGREQQDQDVHIFKQLRSNLPKNYSVPEDLKIFLNSVKSEFMDQGNRNSVLCNLPPDELQALKHLQELQRDRKIVVKPCDKGAGIILLNFEDYLKSCYEHLTSLQSEDTPYYIQVNDIAIEEAKMAIRNIIDDALEKQIITKEEHKAMSAEEKNPGKFYCNFKVHKPHETLPPPRPIISGSDSITENIARYVEHHISSIATDHATYIQDTPDFFYEL